MIINTIVVTDDEEKSTIQQGSNKITLQVHERRSLCQKNISHPKATRIRLDEREEFFGRPKTTG